jgi:hypothetical protein
MISTSAEIENRVDPLPIQPWFAERRQLFRPSPVRFPDRFKQESQCRGNI